MIPFLQHVATDLFQRFGNDLSRTAVVFPNKRASLFFNEYLMQNSADAPVWAPRYLTISELFASLSSLREADQIETVCRLYKHYVAATGSEETLDFFYGWGERLLADFDDVDKNRADAQRLFRNLGEIKALEGDGPVDEEQERVLREFFRDFSTADNSEIRARFLELWNAMYPIYTKLREELLAEGEAYQGQLYRTAVDDLETGRVRLPAEIDRYAIVGFNVLNRVEHGLFSHLKAEGKALFYWDYDEAYTAKGAANAEAGLFLRRNLADFGNELPAAFFRNLLQGAPKEIEFVSSPTENATAASVTDWVRNNLTDDEKRTAVVLCNETLLQPVLHALPDNVSEVNVTKGFPLGHTPAFSLFSEAAGKVLADDEKKRKALQKTTGRTVSDVLPSKEALALALRDIMELVKNKAREIPKITANDNLLANLYTQAYFQTYTTLTRFVRLVEEGVLQVSFTTLFRLVSQVLRAGSVPFHGEPAVGLQVMGVLETRCLDFDHVLMLSVNEGTLPQKVNDNSFIPFDLRSEFGLTTSTHKVAVYAYYFYRLLQRAKRVTMVYNSTSDGLVQGEMSRFMTQLLVETDLPVRHFSLTATPRPFTEQIARIAKPANLVKRLDSISPSAINNYLTCQLRFYFERVAGLREPEPPASDIAPNVFGTIFHKAAELIYKELGKDGRPVNPEQLSRLLKADDVKVRIIKKVREAFAEEKIEGNIIVEEVVHKYLRQVLRYDALHNEDGVSKAETFTVEGLEHNARRDLQVPLGDGFVTMTLKGNIDRLDAINLTDGLTHLRVIDYKTGGNPESAKSMEELFTPSKDRPHYVLQTFLYSLMLTDDPAFAKCSYPITPQLFFVHKAANADYSPFINYADQRPLLDFRPIAAEFEERLIALLAEIIDPNTDFEPTSVAENCKYCPFREMCGR